MADPEIPEHILFSDYATTPRRTHSRKIFGQIVFLVLLMLAAGIGALSGLVFVNSSDLPQVRELEDYRPDVITELYADDGGSIGSFALERRLIVTYNQLPLLLKDAVLSIEDRHFASHWGVDTLRILRAGITDVLQWRKAQGASTLTQQLSRMLFLTTERSWRRKFQEMLLAIQIERRFTKPQIFTMYSNQVNLGHGNYGFAAGAEFYFGKRLEQLTLPEAAMLAGIPKSPTLFSPILHPQRALQRRNLVLAAMLENGKISQTQFRDAKAGPLALNIQKWNNTAPYFVEDIRQFLERKYGTEAVHQKGLRVYTTLNVHLQQVAEQALRTGLREDDKRRGWRGPKKNILKNPSELPGGLPVGLQNYSDEDWKAPLEAGHLVQGLVMEVKHDHALVRFGNLTARVTPPDFAWTTKSRADLVFSPGDVDLFLVKDLKGETLRVTLDQHPDVEGAMVAIENSTGAIKAMVGGYDFEESKFNRARQAERQVGSSFKVYIYAQALLDGLSPFDTILDEPASFPSSSGVWSPHNYDLKYEGAITLLHALAESRNVPAVRLLAKVGIDKVIKLCRKFGLTSRLVPNLPLALGASDLTLLEHTSGFTVFPNDGVRVASRMIDRVTDYDGRVVDEFPPQVSDVLPAPIARLMVSMLRETINSGTATRAKTLANQYPLAGKTGTTNEFSDAWFIGFSPSISSGVWVGFDDHRSLGPKEEGAKVALPIWMDFMSAALQNRPTEDFPNSPLLTKPEQVKEILASTGTEPPLALRAGAPASRDAQQNAATEQPASLRAASRPGTPATPNSPVTNPPTPVPAGTKPPVTPATKTPAPVQASERIVLTTPR
jgi:penicillin-binding protein 1A